MSANDSKNTIYSSDPFAVERKQDHIDLAFRSQHNWADVDNRFNYEPLLAAHPGKSYPEIKFLDKIFKYPIWISSMTGGNKLAGRINENLARACKDFGLGLGLGSCRQLLNDDSHLNDFDVRKHIGDQPLFANLGVAQVELMLKNNKVDDIKRLVNKLKADGLIVHINPLQEWAQPEGDTFNYTPLQTIESLLDRIDIPLIVKEVGQGLGKKSLSALMQLPLAAIDFGAYGGTNFSKLELLRNPVKREMHEVMAHVGHTAEEMTRFTNELLLELGEKIRCREVIISGGIKSYLDGYYLMKKLKTTSIYGQASGFLKHAMDDYDKLSEFIEAQTEGLAVANAFLSIKE